MDIVKVYKDFKSTLPQTVKLVAVSKTKPEEDILKLYGAGHKVFGENKVQELSIKHENLPKDIEWHFIGHLQTNKVKYIAPYIAVLHSVDSIKILREVDKRAKQNKRVIKCLLQFHVAQEESKFGIREEQIEGFFEQLNKVDLNNVEIIGVMGMATFSEDKELVSSEFSRLKTIFDLLKKQYFSNNVNFKEISMGMSNDYKLAISEGSTMLRVGSTIFGAR